MENILPAVGITGIFRLLEPFESALLEEVAYTCVAVRKLQDITAAGGDPMALYYTPYSLSLQEYEQDVANGICIVSLQAGNLPPVYVPNKYIASMPASGGVPYTALILAVALSAVPDHLDLSYLKSKMSDVVLENLGVVSDVRVVAISPTVHKSQADHASLEAARLVRITESKTDYAKYLEEKARADALAQRNAELEAYILSLNP